MCNMRNAGHDDDDDDCGGYYAADCWRQNGGLVGTRSAKRRAHRQHKRTTTTTSYGVSCMCGVDSCECRVLVFVYGQRYQRQTNTYGMEIICDYAMWKCVIRVDDASSSCVGC